MHDVDGALTKGCGIGGAIKVVNVVVHLLVDLNVLFGIIGIEDVCPIEEDVESRTIVSVHGGVN